MAGGGISVDGNLLGYPLSESHIAEAVSASEYFFLSFFF